MRKIILSQEQINNILSLYKSGLGETKIHNQLGISIRHIRRTLGENNILTIGTKRNFTDETFFENIDSEQKAYWLGFLFADGYVRLRNNKYGELRLKLQSKDKSHIQLFKDTIKSDNIIKDITERYMYKGQIKNASSTSFSVYSTKIVNDLINLGCVQNKTKFIEFPNRISHTLIHHFIRGYFDGDGSIYTTKQPYGFFICGSSENFLSKISQIFKENGIGKQDLRKNNNNVFILSSARINDINRIGMFLYNDATVFLKRKKNAFDVIKNKIGKI